MAARERWTDEVQCPGCGAKSVTRWSEEDHPWCRRPNFGRTVDHVDPPFVVVVPEFDRWNPEVHCSTCRIKVA